MVHSLGVAEGCHSQQHGPDQNCRSRHARVFWHAACSQRLAQEYRPTGGCQCTGTTSP